MSVFFNHYAFNKEKVNYNSIIPQSDQNLTYVVGQIGTYGLLSLISKEGNEIWSKYYDSGLIFNFLNAVKADNGDFLIFGAETNKDKEKEYATITRVSSIGNVIWTKRYNLENVSGFLSLISLDKDQYVFATRHKIKEVGYDFSLVKIDGEGGILKVKYIESQSDRPEMGIIETDEGFLVFGGTNRSNSWDDFFIHFNSNFFVTWSKLIGHEEKRQMVKDVLYINAQEFIVTGEIGNKSQASFVYRFAPLGHSASVNILNLIQGQEDSFKKLGRIKDSGEKGDEFILMSQLNSKVESTFTRLNNILLPTWHKKVDTTFQHRFTDLFISDSGNERIRCCGDFGEALNSGLVLRTVDQFEFCAVKQLKISSQDEIHFYINKWKAKELDFKVLVTNVELLERPIDTMKVELCPTTVIDFSKETLLQSPYVYMQASGSDASDDTPKGFHLRWDFKKVLSDKHMAKGSLSGNNGVYPATYGFNKDEDFIKIYRAQFIENYYTDLNFSVQPTSFNVSGNVREWEYANLVPVGGVGTNSKVILTFIDTAAYDALASTNSPSVSAIDFLKLYEGEINMQLDNKLSFRAELDLELVDPGDFQNAEIRYETISLSDSTDLSSELLSERKTTTSPNITEPIIITCEDIASIRFDRVNSYIQQVRFYAYGDYIQGINNQNTLGKIDDFALTLNQNEAYKRLENTSVFQIDGLWPKFNESNNSTGSFKISVQNYQDRWSNSQGLEYGVERYLQLSQNSSNYNAKEIVAADPIGNLPDNSTIEISYLDMIQLTSIDYHLARMLGLGHIDANSNAQEEESYIYLMEYDTLGDLEDGSGARMVKHLYMTPPITILDHKLPSIPELKDPPTYGLAVDNGTANPILLTDAQGYTKFADLRFVNIHRQPYQYEKAFGSFFQNAEPFSTYVNADVVAFGLEYALQGALWIKPELNHDRFYNDASGLPETLMIPNGETNPVYRHQETDEGIHCYSLYSINWFSRSSDLSNNICTDFTKFPKRHTIIPPMNLSVQLVQNEVPPVLTTAQEQIVYDAISGDQTYLRVTFDWNYIHNQAHQFAHIAQLFFNKQEKQILKGEILSVTPLPNNRVQVITGSYNLTSGSSVETIQPNIMPGFESHFTESLFAVGGLNFRVEEVLDTTTSAGENPTFILHQIRETNSVETPTGSNVWLTTESYLSPTIGERFLVSENLGNANNWDNKLVKSIYLESFSTNDELKVEDSTNNDGKYTITQSTFTGTQTKVKVVETVDDTVSDGTVTFDKIHHIIAFNSGNNGFLIAGDVTNDFNGVADFKLFASLDNDGDYTINSVTFNGTNTDIVVNETFFQNSSSGSIAFRKQVSILSFDTTNNLIILNGNYEDELKPSYKELRQNTDGTTTELIMGGLVGECTIVEEPDVYTPTNVVSGAHPGDPIPGSLTGIYTFTFNGNPLPSHVDPDISWFQGKVRVLENQNYLPTPLDSRTDARMKELKVQNVYEDSGNLVLIVVDPIFQINQSGVPSSYTPSGEYVPIVKGSGIEINYHPSYLFYLKVDETQVGAGPETNEFNEDSILPSFGEGSRKTFLGIRAIDGINNDPSADDCASHVATPAAITAQEIRNPEPPLPPTGPLYATRPDFYGKSTYTMDIGFTNVPYSVLVYKANERKILDTLYKPSTVQTILAAIPAPDTYFTQRWSDFVNVVLETSGANAGEFLEYPGSIFCFKIPDNPDYILPQSATSSVQIKPFLNNVDAPGSSVTFTISETGEVITMEQAVRDAISGAFTSQTENPMIFEHIANGDQTSNSNPVLRSENDDLLAPGASGYNATPFAVKLSNGNLRFTDYKIDGGSVSHYFYYAMELSDRQIKSSPSTIVGPIQLVNTRPAKQPGIKKTITQVENQASEIPTAVCFKLEEYIESEGITRIDIYRAIDSIDALTVRTMDLAAQTEINGTIGNTELCDLFDNLDYPLYGEDLHYRLVAMRKIILEDGTTEEYIPSEPSKMVRTSLVDPNNPPAPCITSENGITAATELQNVILKWPQVCYNGTYSLQKMNASGNWVEVYKAKSNEALQQYPPLVGGVPDFTNFDETSVLSREDDDGNPIYHRFRVQVENSSGLFNLSDCPITLATGCFDLQAVENHVSYSDSNGFTLSNILTQEVDDEANNNPGQMTFTANIPSELPAGHNTFAQLDITVTDDLGNTDTKTITTVSGTAVFNDGDGGLQLNGANHTYNIATKLTTDFCTDGFRKLATLSYVHGPCNDLSNLTQIVEITDSTHTYQVEEADLSIDDGVDAPVSLTITDISNVAGLSIPQIFTQLDVAVTDDLGNTDTKTINTAGGAVTFNNGDGGLVLNDGDQNRNYNISLLLITAECTAGQGFNYQLYYSYNPCNAIQALTDVISLTDNSGESMNPLVDKHVNNGISHPGGSITISDIVSGILPTGHSFESMQIMLTDGAGGLHSLPVTAGGSVTFNTGDGDTGSELNLDATNPNPSIFMEINLKTDLCMNGVNFVYSLSYTYDSYEDLGSQTAVVGYIDGNSLTISPLETSPFNDGTNDNPGGSMTLTELISSNLPAGDTFGLVNVTVQDGLGGAFTDTINTIGGSVTISNGQGGLLLDASQPNRTYTFIIKVTSTLCPDGVTFVYSGRYTFGA